MYPPLIAEMASWALAPHFHPCWNKVLTLWDNSGYFLLHWNKITPICAFRSRAPFPVRTFLTPKEARQIVPPINKYISFKFKEFSLDLLVFWQKCIFFAKFFLKFNYLILIRYWKYYKLLFYKTNFYEQVAVDLLLQFCHIHIKITSWNE